MLINYCVAQGWEIYRIYCDEDYSGADRRRPKWNRMLADSECGNVMWKMSSQSPGGLHNGRNRYLKCKATKTADDACVNRSFLRLDLLDDAVTAEINQLLDRFYNPVLLYEDRLSGVVTPEQYKKLSGRFQTELDAARDRLIRADAEERRLSESCRCVFSRESLPARFRNLEKTDA